MKSKILTFQGAADLVRRVLRRLEEDHISLSAAQASFFIITSVIPFISLLFALTGLLFPSVEEDPILRFPFPESMAAVFRFMEEEIRDAPGVSLVSITAVATLWAASRGVSAVRMGLGKIFSADIGPNALIHRLKSLVSTVFVLGLVVASSVLLLFGDSLSAAFGGVFTRLADFLSVPIFIAFQTIVFALIYFAVGRKSRYLRKSLLVHLPGALFSALGWVLFSWIYTLYIRRYPTASTIYGGLGAVCLIMLWLYFCMVILFLGAEVNMALFRMRKRRAEDTSDDGGASV